MARNSLLGNTSPALEALADELADLTRSRLGDLGAKREGVPLENRPALSISEAADLLGISTEFMRGFVDRGEIPSVRMGTRIRLIRRAAIDRWLDDNEHYDVTEETP